MRVGCLNSEINFPVDSENMAIRLLQYPSEMKTTRRPSGKVDVAMSVGWQKLPSPKGSNVAPLRKFE